MSQLTLEETAAEPDKSASAVKTQAATPEDAVPNGKAAAAILAAGIGCAAVGILATLRDASPPVAKALNFYKPSGPLSGVTTVAIVIWLTAWTLLSAIWGKRDVALGRVNVVAFLLLAVGMLFTFPPFMDFLQGK